MHDPLFVYLQQAPKQVGSAYKYFHLLQSHYGGLTLKSDRNVAVPNDYAQDLKELKPRLAFLRGDWLKYYQVAVENNIPYILIEQDVHSLRTKIHLRGLKREKNMIEKAAGIIFTSQDHVDYCKEHYYFDNYAVIHLRPLRRDLAWLPKKKLGQKQLVYAGGLVKNAAGGNYGYRCYKRIFRAFIKAGWTVHIYPSHNQYDVGRAYAQEIAGVIPHGWLPYPELLRDMSQYTAGLQAYAQVDVIDQGFNYTQTCRPNKTWDYLAAGIPTIGLYAGNCAKIYQEGGWGIVIPDIEPSTLRRIKLPIFSKSLRFEQVMDNDIEIFEKVIAVALDEKKTAKVSKKKVQKPEGDEEVGIDLNKAWYRCKRVVIENGVILHGKGKRIPRAEAVRLGLVKKEAVVKEKIIRKRANREKKEAAKKPVKQVKAKKESKPKKKEEVQKLHSILSKREVIVEDKREKEGDE